MPLPASGSLGHPRLADGILLCLRITFPLCLSISVSKFSLRDSHVRSGPILMASSLFDQIKPFPNKAISK